MGERFRSDDMFNDYYCTYESGCKSFDPLTPVDPSCPADSNVRRADHFALHFRHAANMNGFRFAKLEFWFNHPHVLHGIAYEYDEDQPDLVANCNDNPEKCHDLTGADEAFARAAGSSLRWPGEWSTWSSCNPRSEQRRELAPRRRLSELQPVHVQLAERVHCLHPSNVDELMEIVGPNGLTLNYLNGIAMRKLVSLVRYELQTCASNGCSSCGVWSHGSCSIAGTVSGRIEAEHCSMPGCCRGDAIAEYSPCWLDWLGDPVVPLSHTDFTPADAALLGTMPGLRQFLRETLAPGMLNDAFVGVDDDDIIVQAYDGTDATRKVNWFFNGNSQSSLSSSAVYLNLQQELNANALRENVRHVNPCLTPEEFDRRYRNGDQGKYWAQRVYSYALLPSERIRLQAGQQEGGPDRVQRIANLLRVLDARSDAVEVQIRNATLGEHHQGDAHFWMPPLPPLPPSPPSAPPIGADPSECLATCTECARWHISGRRCLEISEQCFAARWSARHQTTTSSPRLRWRRISACGRTTLESALLRWPLSLSSTMVTAR